MDVITLTSEVKETIDLDKMSPDELRKVVKHLWHKVASLSSQVEMNRWRNTPTNWWYNIPWKQCS